MFTRAVVHSKSATAGNPSARSAGWHRRGARASGDDDVAHVQVRLDGPVVPMRRKVRMPSWASSSTAMEVDGPPMPVEQMITALPSIRRARW